MFSKNAKYIFDRLICQMDQMYFLNIYQKISDLGRQGTFISHYK